VRRQADIAISWHHLFSYNTIQFDCSFLGALLQLDEVQLRLTITPVRIEQLKNSDLSPLICYLRDLAVV